MTCTNCFSGCVSTTSDKCVKYTGNDIALLNIHNGDSLEAVEKAISDYLATVFSGLGISPTLSPVDICTIVGSYLPASPTLVDILTAIIKAICQVKGEVTIEKVRMDAIEDTYTVGCLTVDPNAGTHVILEAVITDLCAAIDDITILNNLLPLYVKIGDINTYIQNYIDTQSTTNKMYTKMVPYVIHPFYPSEAIMTGAFDITGAGMGIWEKIYLCNGNHGTPDLRGRSLIGTTDMGGGAFNSVVDPSLGNPTYVLGTTEGKNSVTLQPLEIPVHTHVATSEVTDPGHSTIIEFETHDTSSSTQSGQCAYPVLNIEGVGHSADCTKLSNVATTSLSETGITVSTTNAVNEGGQSHENIHPVTACYYIMYIP